MYRLATSNVQRHRQTDRQTTLSCQQLAYCVQYDRLKTFTSKRKS